MQALRSISLRRTALHLPLRRSERGLLYFYHGLLNNAFVRLVALNNGGIAAHYVPEKFQACIGMCMPVLCSVILPGVGI
jgi:hypothetical protein